MNLHEYQGKQLFAEYGLPVSKGFAVDTPEEAAEACEKIGGSEWVVKAQAVSYTHLDVYKRQAQLDPLGLWVRTAPSDLSLSLIHIFPPAASHLRRSWLPGR